VAEGVGVEPEALKQRREKRGEQENEVVLIENGKATVGGKPTSTWARLIRRIFEVDPLRCKNFGARMRLIAFVTDFHQVRQILSTPTGHFRRLILRP
jgi:hypothetical protein